MLKLLFAISLLVPSFGRADIGFTKGGQFSSVQLLGQLQVICTGENSETKVATADCSANILEPSQSDYFNGPPGVIADQVTLTATHEDQSVRTKSSSYDPRKARSTDDFNLWISTLLQRPLLKEGMNRIRYSLLLKGSAVSSGEFSVKVNVSPTRYCRLRGYTSLDGNDCRNPELFCNRYFYDEGYCRR